MAAIGSTTLTIRWCGDDLDPAEVTQLLGAEPSSSIRKGDMRRSGSGRSYVARTGSWRYKPTEPKPGDLSEQVRETLGELAADLEVWRALAGRFKGDCFCGLFMTEANEGLVLEPDVLTMLTERGLTLMLDIYAPDER